jgi:pimeloyl-ACP methyl ester carboxylesterase
MKNKYLSKTIFRILKIVIPFLIIIFALDSCMQFRMSDNKLQRKFKKVPHHLSIHHYEVDGLKLRYMEVGVDTARLMIFVHGAPGSSKDFIEYLKDPDLVNKFRMISVDRPGYGYSGFGKAVVDIEEQARYLAPLLELNKHKEPPILVGHSYGGPVIARMAMDYPDKANGPLLMLAAAIDPDHEKMFWVNKPFGSPILSWMIPRAFRVSNEEKLAHAAELEKMRPYWEKLQNPTYFIHGQTDRIVDIANSQYGVQMMQHNEQVDSLFPAKMNHLFIWNRYELVKSELLKY